MCGFDSMVTALDVEGEYELAADVYFEIDGELLYVEDSELYFTITVKEGEGGFGIPGFPQIAIVFGLGLTAVMLQNTRKR